MPTTTANKAVATIAPGAEVDRTKTTACTTPHDPSQPLVQYALMIDAGSTGSRIHIYKFNNCQAQATYEYEVFRQTRPGLSSYAGKPSAAAESLDVLLTDALEVVPESLRSCTPVAVKATAGLRLLGVQQAADILAAVRDRLQSKYPFPLADKDSVVIMDGKDEGVYAWITANYLLHSIGPGATSKTNTFAVLDLGGASTQMVFEPVFADTGKSLADGEHKYTLDFGGQTHELYQHSYLGYGLMAARGSVHRLVEFMATVRLSANEDADEVDDRVANPCLSRGTTRVIEVKTGVSSVLRNVTMTGADIGSYEGCRRVVELVLAKDAICQLHPCSFNGVYQPSLLDTFPFGKVLLLSYFYDRLFPLLAKDDTDPTPVSLPISRIAELAQDVCAGPKSWATKFGTNKQAMEELNDRPEYCLDLTFMYTLLRLGYEFEDDRMVMLGKQIDSTELGWALGAGIALVGANLECKA
ncbi:nucleoside phosphatase GDA1/CD39 [Sistotremastrum niveocremeum HHB9708]|uniref:guanosine-diphosphatase n=1 Tax=Sistotremastrum niveocremeum HHB9708 TaxID=1314777 RepID=A0A165AL10_9AGAM|nr:nucleoside phosphatase GDA1/CD39 [Sistotremastrum niveocremeum HHB9708]